MILYIPLEVYTREIKAHLLLATTAVSRGYQVVIASNNDLWIYKRLNLLPRGSYIVKNMNIPVNSETQYSSYIKDGFDIYCQEQEPSTIFNSFQDHINLIKLRTDQLLPFKAVFCWGQRDTNGFKNFFSSNSDIFYNTGSPRADLWTKKYLQLRKVNYISDLKPYILFVLNFGILMGEKHWTYNIKILESLDLIKSDKDLERFINIFKEENKIGYEFVLAIKKISKKFPNINIVVRPHPTANPEYWKSIFHKQKNIIVSNNSDSLSSWISGALVVIQNGCTSAIETIIQKIPLISHGPNRDSNVNFSNTLGVRTKTLIELEKSINNIINKKTKNTSQLNSENILSNILSLKTSDSANLIIDIINRKSVDNLEFKLTYFDIIKMRIVKSIKYILDKLRIILGNSNLTDVNYEIDKVEVIKDTKIISKILNTNSPNITFISKTGMILK